jgi:hypothetical protein
MTITEKKILVNFRISPVTWNTFKRLTVENHSDSSKELRKFVENYIKKHKNNTLV